VLSVAIRALMRYLHQFFRAQHNAANVLWGIEHNIETYAGFA